MIVHFAVVRISCIFTIVHSQKCGATGMTAIWTRAMHEISRIVNLNFFLFFYFFFSSPIHRFTIYITVSTLIMREHLFQMGIWCQTLLCVCVCVRACEPVIHFYFFFLPNRQLWSGFFLDPSWLCLGFLPKSTTVRNPQRCPSPACEALHRCFYASYLVVLSKPHCRERTADRRQVQHLKGAKSTTSWGRIATRAKLYIIIYIF